MKTKPIPVPRDWKDLKPHPLSELIDFGAGIDLDAMAEHMRKHGYDGDEAIVLYEGQILDGRHRHPAVIKAGVTPTFRAFVGKDPEAYVAKKLFRQHLDTSQRALMAGRVAEAMAANLRDNPPSQSQIAETFNVSERSVHDAVKVVRRGTPKLNQAVMDGTISVSDAARVAGKPAEVQGQAVEDVRSGRAATATQAADPAAPALCDRCRRVAPGVGTTGCKACARLGQAKGKRADSRENGQVSFDWKGLESAFGVVVRWPDGVARAYQGQKNSEEYRQAMSHLASLATLMKSWQARLLNIRG